MLQSQQTLTLTEETKKLLLELVVRLFQQKLAEGNDQIQLYLSAFFETAVHPAFAESLFDYSDVIDNEVLRMRSRLLDCCCATLSMWFITKTDDVLTEQTNDLIGKMLDIVVHVFNTL